MLGWTQRAVGACLQKTQIFCSSLSLLDYISFLSKQEVEGVASFTETQKPLKKKRKSGFYQLGMESSHRLLRIHCAEGLTDSFRANILTARPEGRYTLYK